MIGVCTAVIGDVAGHLGCWIYLKDSVNAIAFVALGTSVPGNNSKRGSVVQMELLAVKKSLEEFWSVSTRNRVK